MYTKHKWESDRYFNFKYVKYLPRDYDETKKYPLVFFLHGAGERGEDLDIGSRVYLTGLSMGGTGTWMLAMADPERFAAIAPVCGSGICWYGWTLAKIPTLIYHGDCDETVPLKESITMLKEINGNGGNARLKICYGVGHEAWETAYDGDELYTWMLSQKKERK